MASERTKNDPYVIAGGPAISNPSFFEPFLDAVFIGEADDVIGELVRFLAKAKQQCADRRETLSELAKVFPGIYVPALRNTAKEHHVIRESIFYPTKFIVPNVEAVQNVQ